MKGKKNTFDKMHHSIKSIFTIIGMAGLIMCLFMQNRCARYEHNNPVDSSESEFSSLAGYAQKGPFEEGSVITYSALNEQLEPIFSQNSTVFDNTGYFEISYQPASLLHSVSVNGIGYNEVSGKYSSSSMMLQALASIERGKQFNINILTTLAVDRIKNLILHEERSLGDAMKQAENEILSVFGIEDYNIRDFCTMHIAEAGNRHAVLLAVSLILLGEGSEDTMMKLTSDLSNDIRTDGVVNDTSLIQQLIDNTSTLDLIQIRNQLQQFYQGINVSCVIPPFELYATKLLPFHVASIQPAFNTNSVAVEENIVVEFNKQVDANVVDSNILIQANGQDVPGEYYLDDSGQTLVFIPQEDLTYETTYTVFLQPEFMAMDSTQLQTLYTCSFTTQQAPHINTLPDTLQVTEPYQNQLLSLQNVGGDTLTWEILTDQDWLHIESLSGMSVSNTENIEITVDTSRLAPGDYLGYIVVQHNEGTDTVWVDLTIPAYPEISILGSKTIDFGFHGLTQSIKIRNTGTGVLEWEALSNQNWLTVHPSEGSVGKSDQTVEISINRAQLSGGHYQDQVIVQSNGGNDTLQISMEVIYQLVIQPDSLEGKDASICNLPCTINPTVLEGPCAATNLGDRSILYLESWTYSGYQGTYRSFLSFDLAQLNVESMIDSAVLELVYLNNPEITHSGDNGFYIHRVTADWEEFTITWNDQPEVAQGILNEDRITVLESIDENQDYRIAITEMIQFWQANPEQNYGVRLSLQNETFYRRVTIGSSDAAMEIQRPRLTIYYREP